MAGVVRSLAKAEMEIVILQLQCVGHADVGQGPASVTIVLMIVGAVLQPYAKIARGLAQNLLRIVLAAVGDGRIFLPLDAGEAADPGDYAAELIGHLPGGIKEADTARGEAGNGATVGV